MLFCRVTLGKSFLQFSTMKMAHAPPGHHSVIGRPSVNGLAYAEYVIYRGEQVCYWSNQHEQVTKPSLKRRSHISNNIYSHYRRSMPDLLDIGRLQELYVLFWSQPYSLETQKATVYLILPPSWGSKMRLEKNSGNVHAEKCIHKLSRVSNQPSTASTKYHPICLNAKVSFSSLN